MQRPVARGIRYPTAKPDDTPGRERLPAALKPARVRRFVLLATIERSATGDDFGRDLALVTKHRVRERAGGATSAPLAAGEIGASGFAADGRIAGERTTVPSSQVARDAQLRMAARQFVAGIPGHARSFLSGGAEHQAPPRGRLFATVAGGAP
jgi:hypothetical protein